MKKLLVSLAAVFLAVTTSFAANPITNYKGGSSISFSGTDGTAYAFERWYHDSLVDDHGTFLFARFDPDHPVAQRT
jgi:hypothetical protein